MLKTTATQNHLTIQVAPMTTQGGKWQQQNKNIYSLLKAGMGGLHVDSIVLLD